jgi:prepilin-type processing-associated H-X9-DG protein
MGIYTAEDYDRLGKEGVFEPSYDHYHATCYTFYDLCKDMLNHSRVCPKCGDRMWVAYCDGHVSDECRSCPPRGSLSLQELAEADDGYLDLAGYVTRYPTPQEPLPDYMEYERFEPIRFIDETVQPVDGYEKFMYKDKECNPHYQPIEGYYRMKVGVGTVTAIREVPREYEWSDTRIFEIDGKFEAWIGVTEVKRKYVRHDIKVGDVVEYNLGDKPCVARRKP